MSGAPIAIATGTNTIPVVGAPTGVGNSYTYTTQYLYIEVWAPTYYCSDTVGSCRYRLA